MKRLSFIVDFKTEILIDQPNSKIIRVSVGNEVLGYISDCKIDAERIITPFTSASELTDVHCKACAYEALFSLYYNIPDELIKSGFLEAEIDTAPQENALKTLAALIALKAMIRH